MKATDAAVLADLQAEYGKARAEYTALMDVALNGAHVPPALAHARGTVDGIVRAYAAVTGFDYWTASAELREAFAEEVA